MAIGNLILLSQLTANFATFILSLTIIIPVSMHNSDFRGFCLLFSTGEWQEADGQFKVSWASQGFCNYTIFVGVILLVSSLVQIYRLSMLLYRGQDSSFLSAFVDVVTSVILCIMTITAALMLTLGFNTWCQAITRRFEACEDAIDNDIDKKDQIDTSGFYTQMGTAQFGIWAAWACCVGLSVFAILKLCRYHQEENMRISMARARQKLLRSGMSEDIDEPNTSQRTTTSNGGAGDTIKNVKAQLEGTSANANASLAVHSI